MKTANLRVRKIKNKLIYYKQSTLYTLADIRYFDKVTFTRAPSVTIEDEQIIREKFPTVEIDFILGDDVVRKAKINLQKRTF